MEAKDIDYVFCVGGMTKYSEVWKTITNFFGKEPLKFTDSMESVSRGAAIYQHCDIINLGKRDNNLDVEEETVVDIIPTLPQTVFLNVKDGFLTPLIEAKTKAGTPIIHDNLIKVTCEIGLSLELYAGMSYFDPDLKRLENVKLIFPVGIKSGTDITLKLEYTQKGVLMFEDWIKDNTDIKINLTLEGSQLDESEIEETNKEYGIDEVRGII